MARAAEAGGFRAVAHPGRRRLPDPWIVCAAVAQHTERIGLLVAVRAGFALPTLVAQQAEAFQAVSGGRLRSTSSPAATRAEQRAYGDFLDHDARYARTGEFIEVLRRSWAGGPFDFTGAHYRVDGGGLAAPLADAAAGLLRRRVPGRRGGGRPAGRRRT